MILKSGRRIQPDLPAVGCVRIGGFACLFQLLLSSSLLVCSIRGRSNYITYSVLMNRLVTSTLPSV